MSNECRDQLQRRQKLASENYKVSRGLVKACKEEIKANKCKKQLHNENKTVRLAEILLCLEGKNIIQLLSNTVENLYLILNRLFLRGF